MRQRNDRLAVVRDLKERAVSLLDIVPGAHRLIRDLVSIEVIDRALIIAAQGLFSITPLLVVVAAFGPDAVRDSLVDQVSGVTGLTGDAANEVSSMSAVDSVEAQTGLIGAVFVVISALSYARALQRLYERIWEQPHQGGIRGARRGVIWLAGWVVYLQLLAVAASAMSAGKFAVPRLILQVVLGALVWMWTAHTLLHDRVGWRHLWYGALITAIGMTVLVRVSRVLMPPYVDSTVEQFGGLGILFAISTWLLAYGGVIVVANVLGRVIAEEPRLQFPFWRPDTSNVNDRSEMFLPEGSEGRRSNAEQS